jgi:hypothetical protein
LRKKIDQKHLQIREAETYLEKSSLRAKERELWTTKLALAKSRLREYEDEFWDINCPDPAERCRRRLLEYLAREEERLKHRRPSCSEQLTVSQLLGPNGLEHFWPFDLCSCSCQPQGTSEDLEENAQRAPESD